MTDPIKKIIAEDIKHATEDIARAHSSLVDKQDRRELPVEIFKEEFLPHFTGERDVKDQPTILEKWLTIAGTGFAEVNLIDHAGVVVLTVPSVSSTMHLQVSSGSVSLSDACRQSAVVGSQIKSMGERYFLSALDARQKELVENIVPDSLDSSREKWTKVFQHFGVELGDKAQTPATETDIRLDDNVSFE